MSSMDAAPTTGPDTPGVEVPTARPYGLGRSATIRVSPPAPGRTLALAALFGVLAGLTAWVVGEGAIKTFRPPTQTQHVMGQAIEHVRFEDRAAADLKNAALAYTILGAALGAGLGLAGGLTRGSALRATGSAAVGLGLGAVISLGAALLVLPVYFRAEDRAQAELARDLTIPLAVHAACWAAAGLAAGAAFGVGIGGGASRVANAALGGALGAALGAAVYEVAAAAALPSSGTTSPLSHSLIARLLARVLVGAAAGILTAVVCDLPTRRPATAD